MPRKEENADFKKMQILQDPNTFICWADDLEGYSVTEQMSKIAEEYTRLTWKTIQNSTYENILKRCYNLSYLFQNVRYWGVCVCDDWRQDKNNFYKWYAENYYSVKGQPSELDKDLLSGELYSAETCVFLPKPLNNALALQTQHIRLDENTHKFVWKTQVFDSEREAFSAYLSAKEKHIDEVYTKYKSFLPDYVKQAIEGYSVTIEQLQEQTALTKYRQELRKTITEEMTEGEKWGIIFKGITLPDAAR